MRLILVSILIILTSACKKEELETLYVPVYLQAMIPYTPGEVKKFVSSDGDTVTTLVFIETDFAEPSKCAGCDPYIKIEYYNCFLVDPANTTTKASFADLSIDGQTDNRVFMSLGSPQHNYVVGYGADFTVSNTTGDFDCTSDQICHDTITLNSKQYYDVIEIVRPPINIGTGELRHTYYSKEAGIIKILYEDSLSYRLVE